MGCQQSTPSESELLEKLADQAINKELKDAKDKDNSIIKVLLLGSGSSGKTTLCKQMKVLHTSGFTADEKEHYREVILTNVMDILEALVKCVEVMGHKLDEKNQIAAEALRKARRYEPELRPYILSLSKDRAIQRAFLSEHRPLDMFDAAPYFWEHLDRILADDFEPNNDDILRCRAATTGIVHTSFLIKNSKFAFYDVGGQKNERKKWIHCFENVTAMLYIANLNEYNQTLVEDTSKNRLEDSLQLFDAVVNMRWFKYTSVIVFLNKNDLFEEKIKSVDLGAFHPAYKDGCNYDKALAWITNEYRRRFKADNKTLYFYVTTATNTKNIEKIWRLVADIIITKNLASLGLQ